MQGASKGKQRLGNSEDSQTLSIPDVPSSSSPTSSPPPSSYYGSSSRYELRTSTASSSEVTTLLPSEGSYTSSNGNDWITLNVGGQVFQV